jgi:FMN phosphatase YigB (HAD superfamily)
MTPDTGLMVLFDVDNTLFDNDRFKAELAARLLRDFGQAGSDSYWKHYDALRDRLGYVDYLGALQDMRGDLDETPEMLHMSDYLLDYPFAANLYPDALAAVARMKAFSTPAIFSDGDMVFQPRKIRRTGIWDAVDGRVEIAIHKEQSIDAMRVRFPAAHYVMVDDKPLLLAAMKKTLGSALTTVFVRQGHYAAESAGTAIDPPPDRTIARIGELCGHDRDWFLADTRTTAVDSER